MNIQAPLEMLKKTLGIHKMMEREKHRMEMDHAPFFILPLLFLQSSVNFIRYGRGCTEREVLSMKKAWREP
ncbi:hypothetical protein [Halobacillus kuroshimensis]|uniref:hypothetical protein n=1 Tax=Halobacillus kuroshimensis TaxID=302481 RepID=UPI001A9098FC|nr:hypothetical protein [Halobacillus kuroshimensis]